MKISNFIHKGYTGFVRPAIMILGIGYYSGTNYLNKMQIDNDKKYIQHYVTTDVFEKIEKGVKEKSRNISPFSIFPFDGFHKELWGNVADKIREAKFEIKERPNFTIYPDTLLNLLKK